MKSLLVLFTLLFATCQPLYASTTANLGLTLVDSDSTFNGKFKHNVEKGKWQSNYEAAYIYKKADGVEKTNDFYFQFKENYELAAWFLLLSCNVIVLIILLTWAHSGIHQRKYNQLFFTSCP